MFIVFDEATQRSADHLIELGLQEDLRERGDLTCRSTIPEMLTASVNIVSRQAGVLSGLVVIASVFKRLPGEVTWTLHLRDGDTVAQGSLVATITGPVRSLLTGERTVLNFLTHLSGIATRTAEFVRAVQGTKAVILDTRKTLPGYRLLQKYAVRCGGGTNHRMGLYDGVLIKDNHLAARGDASCASAVADARAYLKSINLPPVVEIEVDSLEQLKDALAQQPDIVLLDNMAPDRLTEAVQIRNAMSPTTQLEASGGVSLQTVRSIAESGVDRISVGGLTHSSPALDLGFDWPW